MVTVGIDEVGRGCWAGPLVAAAVALDSIIIGVKDSKKLSKKKRNSLSTQILQEALDYGIGWVSVEEIDTIGLTRSVRLAMQRALDQIGITYEEVIVDGNFNFLESEPKTKAIVRADGLIPSVGAASIIAKVARDTYMANASKVYTDYGFERHVGYGTALHVKMLKLHGVSPIHRRSFRPIQVMLKYLT
jgi:ribonuclease HII